MIQQYHKDSELSSLKNSSILDIQNYKKSSNKEAKIPELTKKSSKDRRASEHIHRKSSRSLSFTLSGKKVQHFIVTELPFKIAPKFNTEPKSNLIFHDKAKDNSTASQISVMVRTTSMDTSGNFSFKSVKTVELPGAVVEDLRSKPSVMEILKEYYSDVILKKHVSNKSDHKIYLEKLYNHCITKEKSLNCLFRKNIDMIPIKIRENVKRERAEQNLYKFNAKCDIIEPTIYQSIKEDTSLNLDFPNCKGYYSSGNPVFSELINDNDKFKRFYHPLILGKLFLHPENDSYIHIKDKLVLDSLMDDLTFQLSNAVEKPDAKARRDLLDILKCAAHNLELLKALTYSVHMWFDALLLGVHSSFLTVIEDICILITIMCSKPYLAANIINHYAYDVPKDTIKLLLNCIEEYPLLYDIYSIPIAFIINCSQRFSILEVIFEMVTKTQSLIILKRWPYFIYYATRIWDPNQLLVNQIIVKRIIHHLEQCLIKRLSKKQAKKALVSYCKVSLYSTNVLTIAPEVSI